MSNFIPSGGMKYKLDPSFHKGSGSFVGWLKCLILKIPHFLVVEGERMTSYRERQISLCLVSFGGQICRVDGVQGGILYTFPRAKVVNMHFYTQNKTM